MKSAPIIAVLILLLAGVAGAQTSYRVEMGKTLAVEIAGATAAYSLSATVADASYANGVVRIVGIDAGKTTIMVITPAGLKTLSVEVTRPPLANSAATIHNEFGNYGFQYSSDPHQITNSIDYTREFGESFQRLQLSSTAYLTGSSNMASMPVLSLQLHAPERDVTLLDQRVSNSTLTVDQTIIRGLHLGWKEWEFHGGYSTMLAYQNVLLSTDPEYVFGVSRRFSLSDHGTLLCNLYYFSNPASAHSLSRNGPIGTVGYGYRRREHSWAKAEFGMGSRPAVALSVLDENPQHHLSGGFRVVPAHFSTLALNSQHGSFGELQFNGALGRKYSATASSTLSDYDLPQAHEKLSTISGTLTRILTGRLSVNAGSSYSHYSSSLSSSSLYQTVNFPVGVNFQTHFFHAGAQYLPTSDLAGDFASGYSFNGGVPIRRFQLAASYQHDVQIPSVTSIIASNSSLQQLLLQAGITVTSLDQLMALLSNSAELNALGFSNLIGLNLSSTRDDFSTGLNWSSGHKEATRLGITFDDSRSTLPGSSPLHYRTETAIYSRKIGNDELSLAASIYQSNMARASTVQPAFQVAYRHPLHGLPVPLLMRHHGIISGHAFYDPASSSRYAPSLRGVDGAEVWLDGTRMTHTDEHGYYWFGGIPYGDHRIEIKYSSSEPYFFTTDSQKTVPINSTVDFGLNFVQGYIYGFLRNDAGAPIAGVALLLQAEGVSRRVISGGEGSFRFRGLNAGTYTVVPEAASFPSGYDLQDVEEKTVAVTTEAPAKVEFSVRALRSVSGEVSIYDAKLLKEAPVPGAVVKVVELGIQTRSDAQGRYVLRRMPAGSYTLSVEQEGAAGSTKVEVPQRPGAIREVNLVLQRR
jgi:hypothetical protein